MGPRHFGVVLEKEKAPVDMVVDHAEKNTHRV